MTTTENTSAASEGDEQPIVDPDAVSITLNGTPITARRGELIINAAERHGEYIPRFCYHERMNPVGMCRMCLVEVDTGRGPQITPSCMVQVAPEMKVDTQSPTVKRMQEGVLELLLANHPLDCPVCDKGGECPLQDQTMAYGPGESRFVEEKRHYEKPIPISDLVFLDRERCILCDRCTRFADEVAGDALIHFIRRGNNTEVNTFPDEPFSSYFSGNTVQICPVGALTSKPYRFKARPWDLEQVESTCTTCSVGCRMVVQSSRDELVRFSGVDSDPVNWGWMCDRGRFNWETFNSDERLTQPLVRAVDGLTPANWNTAISLAAEMVRQALSLGGPQSIAVIGGARGTNEDAYAWARVAHDVFGTPHTDAQLGDGLPVGLLGLERATIDDAAAAATVVLLGPDLKQELPVLYLRLRDAAVHKRHRIVEFTARETGMSPYTWKTIVHESGSQRAAVADALADPAVAAQLRSGPVVIVAGRANLAESGDDTVAALADLLAALPGAKVLPALRRGNVVGALELGLRPGAGGADTRGILEAAVEGRIECLVLLGADPLADFPDADLARRGLAAARRIIAVDTFLSDSSSLADVVLPAASFAEKDGTTTNLEGRVTRVRRKVTAAGTSRPDWMVAVNLAAALGHDLGYGSVDEITAAIAAEVPAFAAATAAALDAAPDGVLTTVPSDLPAFVPANASAGSRGGYDFRLLATRSLYDRAVSTAKSPALASLAPGAALHMHPLDLERAGVIAGADVRVVSSRAAVVLRVEPDESVPRGSVWVPFNQPGGDVAALIDATQPVTDVRMENL